MTLNWLDMLIVAIPFVLVIGVSLILRSYVRSVADFLAAGRCAGRYLICSANAELTAGATNMLINLEIFYNAGFTTYLWASFDILILFMLALNGLVSYRFRETRSLTFHQFFEVRYSKGVRIFASLLNFASGSISFAVQPAIGARFIVYFCNVPQTYHVGPLSVSTVATLMVVLLTVSLFMTLTGGQISVMVTDCMEGLISGIFYLVIAISVLCLFSYAQMKHGMLSGPTGQSLVNPLDIKSNPKFDFSYVIMLLALRIFSYRGSAAQPGFAASARSPHEGKMSGILTQWRAISSGLMTTCICVAAVTVLHSASFADKAAIVQQRVSQMPESQRSAMQMPIAVSLLLPMGARGALCACMLFGMLAGLGGQMHANGSGFVQDVLIPLRKTPLTPERQIRWLRMSAIGLAIFGIVFGLFYSIPDMLIFVFQLMGAIYLCVGAVVWGGLYWKRGTTAGAWASLSVGAFIAILSLIAATYWKNGVASMLVSLTHHIGWQNAASYLSNHKDTMPIRLQVLTCISYAAAGILYIGVSLLTSVEPFDLDRLLHRGKYRVEGIELEPERKPSKIKRLLGFNKEYSRTDKFIAIFALCWTLTWALGFVTILLFNLFVHRWSDSAWFRWSYFKEVVMAITIGVFTTTWFTIGGTRDLIYMFRILHTLRPDINDNGMVLASPVVSPDEQPVSISKTIAAVDDAQAVVMRDE